MLFEDKYGKLLTSEKLDTLQPFEIEERGIHLFEKARELRDIDNVLFEDTDGTLLLGPEVDILSALEIEERGIRVFN